MRRMQMIRITLIGVGGIGTCLLSFLPRFLSYQRNEGVELTLIDGDSFEARNLSRQSFAEQGNKADVKARELRINFPQLTTVAISEYVTKKNIRTVVKNGDIVFLAVDNHATRLLVSQRCQQLRNITLISAGNDLETGSCQVYIREKGQALNHPIEFFHSEIQNPEDQNPGDVLDCLQMTVEGESQIVITNMAAALCMACALYQTLERILPSEEMYFSIRTGAIRLAERRVYDDSSSANFAPHE